MNVNAMSSNTYLWNKTKKKKKTRKQHFITSSYTRDRSLEFQHAKKVNYVWLKFPCYNYRVKSSGSFTYSNGVLLFLNTVGQGPAVLAAGAGRVGYIFLFFTSIFSFLYPVFWETTEHDWNIVVSAVKPQR